MASTSQTFAAHPTFTLTGRRGLIDTYFYFVMSLTFVAIVVWGFGHTVNDFLIHPAVPRPLLLWFHATAFSTWLLLFVLQSALVRTHNVRLHRTLGWSIAGLGAVMIPLGITTGITMGRFNTGVLHEVNADLFEFVSFYDMAAFTTLLALGIYWRRKPELHRRLMFLATCGLMSAAFGRIPYLGSHNLFYVAVDAVICLGLLRDLLVDRRIHRVYLIALPLLAIAQFITIRVITTTPPWWSNFAHPLMG